MAASSFLHLRERALAYVAERGRVDEAALLVHVFGGTPPTALHGQLLAPLVDDPRLVRCSDGSWTAAGAPRASLTLPAFTALALTTTGANPDRARIVRVVAMHLAGDAVIERFDLTVNPGVRVPRYVAERVGLGRDLLDDCPPLDPDHLDALVQFLGARPIAAQEAGHAWCFLIAEARRLDRALPEAALVDVNMLAASVLDSAAKPSLALIARHFDVGFSRIEQPDDEARVLGLVVPRLFEAARQRGVSDLEKLHHSARDATAPLRSAGTARALPESPGVYVLRDSHDAALYVGKARRLRDRMSAYVHRPLGATRRLEGLAAAVQTVDTLDCASDLEALVLEDRAIRRLQPRFNTQLGMRPPRTWLRLPPAPPVRAGSRQRALQRLERVVEPSGAGEFLGPFRNDRLAHVARDLARSVFDLDRLRLLRSDRYVEQLRRAWEFLHGETSAALELARTQHARAVAARDDARLRRWQHVMAAVRDYAPALLPADPRSARFAVLRPGIDGLEGFLLERGILLGWCVLDNEPVEPLLQHPSPRTAAEDVDVVLHWLGAQRAPARLVHLPDGAADADQLLADAVSDLLAEQAQCS